MTRRRRGTGCIVFLVIAALVVVGLAVADRYAAAYAERQVADALRSQLGMATAPKVSIEGVPFLTQVAANRFTEVNLDGDDAHVTDGGQTITLRRVRLRLGDVLTANRYRTVTASRLEGTALVSWSEVSHMVNLPIGDAGAGRVRIDASQKVYGQTIRVGVTGVPHIDPAAQTFTLSDPQVQLAGMAVPDSIVKTVMQDVVKPAPVDLPLGLRATTATPSPDGLDIAVTGQDVPLLR